MKGLILKSSALVTVLTLVVSFVNEAYAGGGFPPPPPPTPIPIDGGVGVLIAAAAVYGGKKIYDRRKNNKT